MFISKLFLVDKNTYKKHVYFRDTSSDRKTINFGLGLVNKANCQSACWDPNCDRSNRDPYDGVKVTSHMDLTGSRNLQVDGTLFNFK